MLSPAIRQALYLLLLVATLAAVLWLADAWERNAVSGNLALAFSPPSGAYDHDLLLEMQPSRPGASIVFSTNGTLPSASVGTLYERPLRLDSGSPGVTVVRAREFVNDAPGAVQSASYVMGVEHSLPILSIIADPANLWDPERGILYRQDFGEPGRAAQDGVANTWRRGQAWERPVHVTYFEGDHSAGFEIPAGLRIHGDQRFDRPKQSFLLYFRQEYGAARLEYPLFHDHQQDTPSYKRLVLQAGDKLGRWTLLDAQLLADVATEVNSVAAQGRFVLLFLNGEPWGIYRLSERIDRFFLQDRFGVPSADLFRDGELEEGDDQHWNALMSWLETHDLSDPANYEHLRTQIDLDSLTDCTILQMYFGLAGGNVAARPRTEEGRWFWLCGGDGWRERWTSEAGPARLPFSDATDDVSLLRRKLLENPTYRARFLGRLADVLNTALSPATMQARVDGLAAQLRPDIGYETARWPVALRDLASGDAEWERNVAALHEFVQRRPDELRRQVAAEFDLRGTASLTFSLSTEAGGYLVVNGSSISALPWSGSYFLDATLRIIAVPAPGYVFDGWGNESPETRIPATPHPASRITLTVDGPRTLTARFVPVPDDAPGLRPNDVIFNEYWINDNGTRYASVGGQPIEGDWLELLVTRPRSVDLRGWRITDNDTKTATDEGSIILPSLEIFASLPRGTAILIIATASNANAARFPVDDLDPSDGRMVLYVGNGHLDVTTDPGFNIGVGDDNLVLLAPGPDLHQGPEAGQEGFADDIGVDFIAEGDAVTPLSFGVLADGVRFETPFQGLSGDDGALFRGRSNNDNGAVGWIVDPASTQSGDDPRPGATNILSPGALNNGQDGLALPTGALGLLLVGLAGTAIALRLRARRG